MALLDEVGQPKRIVEWIRHTDNLVRTEVSHFYQAFDELAHRAALDVEGLIQEDRPVASVGLLRLADRGPSARYILSALTGRWNRIPRRWVPAVLLVAEHLDEASAGRATRIRELPEFRRALDATGEIPRDLAVVTVGPPDQQYARVEGESAKAL